MKISNVEALIVGAGWRPWIYVKVETDEGVTGWGECSDPRTPKGIAATVADLRSALLGQDPRAFEARFADMSRLTRSSPGGIAAKAMAGIECALLDIKAKALGVSVAELFGGPTRDQVRLYWSHCGSTRVRYSRLLGTPPIETWADIGALGKEVVARGFTALKTNIVLPGKGGTWYSGFDGTMGPNDEWAPNWLVAHTEKLIGTFRDAVGPDFDINLDLNFHFKPEACMRIAKALEPYNLHWLEVDCHDPDAVLRIKQSTSTRICTGETLIHMEQYLPYFERHAADVFMIDVPWNGFAQGKKVGNLAETFKLNVAPHNYYSHLSSFISAQLCAVLPNVRIMEIDIDDVPWKDELVTATPEIDAGYMTIPQGPGWGADVVEEIARAHPWDPDKAGPAKSVPPPRSY
ncbi:MAG: mandelate racemase/muconate lactonizing enzyme family protein [Burkholderiales bacterium]